MERVLVGFGPNWRGVGLQHTRGLFGPSVNRWSIKRSPNGTKLDRWSTGSKPRPHGKSQSNRKCLIPTHEKKVERTTGGDRSARMQNRQWGKCSDAWDEHVCNDMKCMTWTKSKTKTKPNHEGKSHIASLEKARVGVTNMESCIRGITNMEQDGL